MKLAILIPTLPERKESFESLCDSIVKQVTSCKLIYTVDVDIIYDAAPRGVLIGTKRNWLMSEAVKVGAEYVCFIDDDDKIQPNYISNVMEGINKGVDACSLRGIITWDGQNPEVFEHSIKYSEWKTNSTGDIKYFRCPNHLNAIKTSIASQFKFPEINREEDIDWSMQILASGLIKTEHFIDEVIYNYEYVSNK